MMAAVLRSSLGKTIRCAHSLEGNLSLHLSQQCWRLLHAGRTAPLTGASHAKRFLKSSEFDPLVKKIDGVARRAALVEYTQSLVQEDRRKLRSLGIGVRCIIFVTAGYHMGFYRKAEEEH